MILGRLRVLCTERPLTTAILQCRFFYRSHSLVDFKSNFYGDFVVITTKYNSEITKRSNSCSTVYCSICFDLSFRCREAANRQKHEHVVKRVTASRSTATTSNRRSYSTNSENFVEYASSDQSASAPSSSPRGRGNDLIIFVFVWITAGYAMKDNSWLARVPWSPLERPRFHKVRKWHHAVVCYISIDVYTKPEAFYPP